MRNTTIVLAAWNRPRRFPTEKRLLTPFLSWICLSVLFLLVSVTPWTGSACATEYHVSQAGDDGNPGTARAPFRTISAAARIARPGDIVTVHEGTYRERVNPPRGGTSDDRRIVYRAAAGEPVVIKGSEIVKQWRRVRGDVWKAVLPNSFFGDFNPYKDTIGGEWYRTPRDGFDRHTGAVYLNEDWLSEARMLDDVLRPAGEEALWFARVDAENTTIWAQFKGLDPNEEMVEINVRQSIFYPSEPGLNFITVRGFTMRHAATPWSGAMSEQIGLVGTHWSKRWVIEDNTISHSVNTAITLGRYDLGRFGIALPEESAPGFVRSCELALEHGWSKANIGSHLIRNNHISHCEKNGIHGSLGGVFSTIEGNTVCDIAVKGWLNGPDRAGLKLLASNDVLIKDNHLYRCFGAGGIWLDWMAQGTRVTGNLLHDNRAVDLFMEVNHGPFLIDHNLFLSRSSLRDWSQGGAYVHNLFAGALTFRKEGRQTPYFKPHSVADMKISDIQHKDVRFFNNVFAGRKNLSALAGSANVQDSGNLFLPGATFSLEERQGEFLLAVPEFPTETAAGKCAVVTSERLGKAAIPGAPFEQPDGSPYRLDTDYFGRKMASENPIPGPFASPNDEGGHHIVWPKE